MSTTEPDAPSQDDAPTPAGAEVAAPVADAPVADPPVADAPVADPPGADTPVADAPVADGGGAHRAGTALAVAALGVVFGDIGTSPLYALQTVFTIDQGAVRPTAGDVYGVISLMFWSVTLIVTIKYVSVVMRADKQGEGGVMA